MSWRLFQRYDSASRKRANRFLGIASPVLLRDGLLYNAFGDAHFHSQEMGMNAPTKQTDLPLPTPGPDDPPVDFSRELAAYAKEEKRLVRDHPGWIALIHGDEVVGAFPSADKAYLEGIRRFGHVRMMFKEIRDPSDPPDFVSRVDI